MSPFTYTHLPLSVCVSFSLFFFLVIMMILINYKKYIITLVRLLIPNLVRAESSGETSH